MTLLMMQMMCLCTVFTCLTFTKQTKKGSVHHECHNCSLMNNCAVRKQLSLISHCCYFTINQHDTLSSVMLYVALLALLSSLRSHLKGMVTVSVYLSGVSLNYYHHHFPCGRHKNRYQQKHK